MDPNDILNIGAGAIVAIVLVYLVYLGFVIWAFVRIMQQSGNSPHWAWLFLGLIIPFVNVLVGLAFIVLYFVFAFKEWPVRRELRELRAWADEAYRRSGGQAGPPPPPGGYQYGYQPGYQQQGGYPQSGGFQQPGYGQPGGYGQY